VLTANCDNNSTIECLNAGAHRYFLKPVNLDEFRHALTTTLHTFQLEREQERYREHLEETVRRQMQKVRRTFLAAIDSMVLTLEAKDFYTKGHSLRVCQYSLRLAEALGLDRQQRRRLTLAAKLHDIGKIGVSEVILNKPASLSDEEYRQVQQHPVI